MGSSKELNIGFEKFYARYGDIFERTFKYTFLKIHNTLVINYVIPILIIGMITYYSTNFFYINNYVETIGMWLVYFAIFNYFIILLICKHNNKQIKKQLLCKEVQSFLNKLLFIFEDPKTIRSKLNMGKIVNKHQLDIVKNIHSIKLRELVFLYSLLIVFASNIVSPKIEQLIKVLTKEDRNNALDIVNSIDNLVKIIDKEIRERNKDFFTII